MAPKKNQNSKSAQKLPVAQTVAARKLIDAEDKDIELRKANEVAELLWLPDSLEKSDRNARIVRALELFEDLKPQGSAEGMLAAQMVGTHSAALDCLRRAAIHGQGFEARDMNLKHAQKLMSLYTQQLNALNKHRGKGQQKVTVEHVNVAPGGQAIVGNVETGGARRIDSESSQAIEHSPDIPVDELTDKEAVSRDGSK